MVVRVVNILKSPHLMFGLTQHWLEKISLFVTLSLNRIQLKVFSRTAAKSSFNFHHIKATKSFFWSDTEEQEKFPFTRGEWRNDDEKFGMKLSGKKFHILCDLSSDTNSYELPVCVRGNPLIQHFSAPRKMKEWWKMSEKKWKKRKKSLQILRQKTQKCE